MNTRENPSALFDAVAAKLTQDDDPNFWQTALAVLKDEFLRRYDEEARNREWVLIVGACSHWVWSHNSTWNTSAGRFAWPVGYKDWSPELDWSVIFVYQNGHWKSVEKLPGKRVVTFRVALPARTVRHKQAAINTRWSPAKEVVLYGFRNTDGRWKCVAASDEKLRGRVSC
jgi:hypothetical protein